MCGVTIFVLTPSTNLQQHNLRCLLHNLHLQHNGRFADVYAWRYGAVELCRRNRARRSGDREVLRSFTLTLARPIDVAGVTSKLGIMFFIAYIFMKCF